MQFLLPGILAPPRLIWLFVLIELSLVLMTGMIGRGYMIAVSFQSFCSSPMAAMEEIDQKALKYHRAVQNLSNTAPALLPEKILRPLDTTRRQFCRILAVK